MPAFELTPHPTPRYRDVLHYCRFRRTPDSDIYEARVRLPDGEWTNWFSLRTRDFEEAKERGIEQLSRRRERHDSGIPQPGRVKPVARAEFTFREVAEELVNEMIDARADLARRHGAGSGKANTVLGHITTIQKKLIPVFGDKPVRELTRTMVNTWARAQKVEARRGPEKGKMVTPGQSTIGSWNHSLQKVLERAVEKGWLDEHEKGAVAISQKGFEKAKANPTLFRADVEAMRDHMTDAWVEEGGGREFEQDVSREVRYLLRAYVALGTCTGIRPGEEMELILPRQIRFMPDGTIQIPILAHQGKYGVERTAFVFVGDAFPVRRILQDLIRWRRDKGVPENVPLFALPSSRQCPNYAPPFKRLLEDIKKRTGADILVDPKTGLDRVPYSMRHYYATSALFRGTTYDRLSKVMGTSPEMLRKHYDHVLVEAHAAEFTGHSEADEAERMLTAVRRTRERLPGYFDPAPEDDGTQPYIDNDEMRRVLSGLER